MINISVKLPIILNLNEKELKFYYANNKIGILSKNAYKLNKLNKILMDIGN